MAFHKKLVAKQCITCERTFRTRTYARVYCKPSCGKTQRGCAECGTVFARKKDRPTRFCSRACWYKHPGKKVLAPRPCKVCGAEFNPRRETTATCSRTCGNAAKRSPRRLTQCAHCTGPMPASCDVGNRFCSRSCAGKAKPAGTFRASPIGTVRSGGAGYLIVKVGQEHSSADHAGWYAQHRLLAEEALGRRLEKHERVHHRNGVRDDNTAGPCVAKSECDCDVEPKHNLELWKIKSGSKKDPSGIRAADYHCPGCRCSELHP